eukprot:scaffold22774_cov55-Attheya_sp.AAC.2
MMLEKQSLVQDDQIYPHWLFNVRMHTGVCRPHYHPFGSASPVLHGINSHSLDSSKIADAKFNASKKLSNSLCIPFKTSGGYASLNGTSKGRISIDIFNLTERPSEILLPSMSDGDVLGVDIGELEGLAEGLADGETEGEVDGLLVGWELGEADGVPDGTSDGNAVGLEDGVVVGSEEGDDEGLPDGELLGYVDGRAVGFSEGDTVGCLVGESLGINDSEGENDGSVVG